MFSSERTIVSTNTIIRTGSEILNFLEHTKGFLELPGVSERSFGAGDSIIQQGQMGNDIFLIREGLTKCFVTEENGKEFVQEFLGKGQLVGEIELLLGGLSFCSVIALSKVSAIKISRLAFGELKAAYPHFNMLLSKALAVKLKDTAIRASYQQTYSTEKTLKNLMMLSKDTKVRLIKSDISSYLGITARALNRLLKKLDSEQI